MKKIKKIILIAGTFFISGLSFFSLVSCSTNNSSKENLLDNSVQTWNTVFNQQISSNYKKFITTNITTSVNDYMNQWNNFVSYYSSFTKDETLIIPFQNFTLYIYSYDLSLAKNYPITFSSEDNHTFNCEFIWNLTFGIKVPSYQNTIYKYNLVITDELMNATMSATVLTSWTQLINSKIKLYGGWYISAVQNSIIGDHLTDLTPNSNKKIQDEIGSIFSLLNLNGKNLKFSNPSSANWISVSMFTPLSGNNNLLKEYLLTQIQKTYGFPTSFFKYFNFEISGFDEYLNKIYPLNLITNPDLTYFNQLFNWLKKETNSNDEIKNA